MQSVMQYVICDAAISIPDLPWPHLPYPIRKQMCKGDFEADLKADLKADWKAHLKADLKADLMGNFPEISMQQVLEFAVEEFFIM